MQASGEPSEGAQEVQDVCRRMVNAPSGDIYGGKARQGATCTKDKDWISIHRDVISFLHGLVPLHFCVRF
jgi:hypothetical protein